MKSVVCTKYGPPEVLKLKEYPKPTPKADELLVKIHVTTVSTADVINRSFKMPFWLWPFARMSLGITKPKKPVLGFELSGEVEAVGKNVKLFKKGDQVFGSTFEFGFGCYAEYTCISEKGAVALKPTNLTHQEAVVVPLGGLTALAFVRDGAKVRSGQKVLIIGASGSVGTYAVQLAIHYGAEVTGVCSSANIELVKSLGADKVVNYTKEDFTQSGEKYDVIFDVVNKTSFSHCRKSLNKNGKYLMSFPTLKALFQMLWTSIVGGKKVISGEASEKAEDLVFLKGLVEKGELKPIIDRVYPLEQIVDAHRYVEAGHKKGNVLVSVSR